MPTDCPQLPNACGTLGSIWLAKGQHPTIVNNTKTLKACVFYERSCCALKPWDVKVKKCSVEGWAFFVYYLRATPGCPMRYCAGKERKCDEDERSLTGFSPNCSLLYPRHKKDPVISVHKSNNKIKFKCQIYPEEKGENVHHEITWYQGTPEKQINRNETISNGTTEAFLLNNEKKQLFYLGQIIYCKVRSYYVSTPNIKRSFRRSNLFFAGIKIEPNKFDISLLEKGKPYQLKFTSTVPIICKDGSENCEVRIDMGMEKTDALMNIPFMVNLNSNKNTDEVKLVAKRDFQDDGSQTMHLKLHIGFHLNVHDFNNYRSIPSIKVTTTNVKTSQCQSVGNHIKTFDGLHFDHYHIGDYVLVESKARLFQVHVRTSIYYGSANCGIAAREGDDVIVIDMCLDRIPRARFASTIKPQEGTSLEMENNGKTFLINFPSGASIQFRARHSYAVITVQIPSDDYQNTVGLCGTFDDDFKNDMRHRNGLISVSNSSYFGVGPVLFTESWKISGPRSLFHYKGRPKKRLAIRQSSYCSCKDNTVNCKFAGFVHRPKYKKENGVTIVPVNAPPVFKNTNFYTFKGQSWRQDLSIIDPEKNELKYEFIGESYGMNISSAGIITWHPLEVGSFNITVKATDICGLSAQNQLEVNVTICSCEGRNNGYCKYVDSENDTCVCPNGCKGKWCMDSIEEDICDIQGNTPPIFQRTKFRTFRDQMWHQYINVTDLQNQNIAYTFVGEHYGMNISSSGIIKWLPTEVGLYKVTVEASDTLGLSTQKDLTVDVAQCTCGLKNGAQCWYLNDGNITCLCPDGCQGEWCKQAIDGRRCLKKGAQSPPIPDIPLCASKKFGCCWDNVTIAEDETGLGCPACTNKHSLFFCQSWRFDCTSAVKTRRTYLRLYCPTVCGVPCDYNLNKYKCEDDPANAQNCIHWFQEGQCKIEEAKMRILCPVTCKLCS